MGEKQFNFRLAFWLLASLTVATTLVHLVHGFQVQRQAAQLHAQALHAAETGDDEQTALLLKRYLLFAPGNTAALLSYGETLEKLPDKQTNRGLALAAFKQVLNREPNRQEVRRHLVDLLLETEQYGEAREHLEILQQAAPEDALLEMQLARCLEEEGEYEQALKAYEKIVGQSPALLDAYSRQAVLLYSRFNQPEAAAAIMDQLVQANPQNFAAYLERCLYRMGCGQLDEAGRDLAEARQRAPTDARVRVTAAQLAYQQGRTDDARAAWTTGIKEQPRTRNMYLGLATLELSAKRPQQAIVCLQSGLEVFPNHPDLLHLLVEALLAQNDFATAESVAARVRKESGAPALADYLQARILLQRNRWGEALPVLEKALKLPDVPNPLLCRLQVCLAQCYERLGDRDRALAEYRKAVALEPSQLPAQLGLARALLAAGKSDKALSLYRQLSRQSQPPEDVWILLGRTLLQRNLALAPKDRHWVELERTLQRADQYAALIVPAAILRTDLLLAQGKADEARQALVKARDRKPDQPALWTALANLTARRGDRAGAERLLMEARQRLGERVELRLAALELGAGLDERSAKATLLAHEKTLPQFTPAEQQRLRAALAETYFRLGFVSDGERLTRVLAAQQPLDLPGAIVALELALQGSDASLQIRLVTELHRLEGEDGTWWRYGEARTQLQRYQRGERPAEAEVRRLLAELALRRPDWSRAALLEASLCELNQDAAGALAAYTKAFEQGERQTALVYRLMRLLVSQGHAAEADEVLVKAQQQVIPSGEFARFAAENALQVRQYEHAAMLARLAVPADSRDPRQYIWLGQLLAAAERRPEAEEALKHAVELRENLPEPWIALLAFYAATDQVQLADDALEALKDKLGPAQQALVRALSEEALGRMELAERHYLEARTQRPNDELTLLRLAAFYVRFQQTQKAEPALRALFDPTLRLTPEQVKWARRELALLCAERDEAGYREALALLETNGKGEIADVRAASFIQATRGAKERAAALPLIEETRKDLPLGANEQFRLAKLYDAKDEWGNAQDLLTALLEQDRRNPEYLAYFLASLVRRDQREVARTWLEKLDKLEPDSARVKAFRQKLQ